MADHRVPSQQANPISSAYPHAAFNQLQGQNPHVAGDFREGVHREDVAQPVAVQREMQYPAHIDAPNYNAAYYHPPPPAPQVPYVHMYRDDPGHPAQAHPFAPGVQGNYDGYGAHFPAARPPPEAFPGDRPYPAPPAANDLRNIVGRFLNNPGTLVNMLWIEPGPDGRIGVWIALEMADLMFFGS